MAEEEKDLVSTNEMVGLTAELGDVIDKLHNFCTQRITSCTQCPMFSGIMEEGMQCVFQNLPISEIHSSRLIDMNSYNIAVSDKGFPNVGDFVRIGMNEFVVLDYVDGCAVLYSTGSVRSSSFGASANYKTSRIRTWLNEYFYNEISGYIGKDNIIKHKVDLTAEDGTEPQGETRVEDFVSLITLSDLRKYSKHISHPGWSWLATRKTWGRGASKSSYVCCTDIEGQIDAHSYSDSVGYTRPLVFVKAEALASLSD